MHIDEKDEFECLLRANDFDWSKHVNNSVYLQLFESGRWSWSRKNGLGLVDSDLIGLVSSITIDYVHPIEWEPLKIVKVSTIINRVESYSVFLDQEVRDDETIYTKAKVRIVLFDSKRRFVVPIKEVLEQKN